MSNTHTAATTSAQSIPPGAEDLAAAGRNRAVDQWEKAQAEISDLKGQLEAMTARYNLEAQMKEEALKDLRNLRDQLNAAEQHVKVLTEARTETERQFQAKVAEIGTLLCERDSAREQIHDLREEQQHLIKQRDTADYYLRDAQDRLIRAGLASPRPEVPKHKASTQRVRPWRPEEVPLGCWLRMKTAKVTTALVAVRPAKVSGELLLGDNTAISFGHAALMMEHSTDGGRTWSPAGAVEAAT